MRAEYGLIFPLRDAVALAEAIRRMLNDEALRERFAAEGLVRSEEYDLPIVMQHNQDILLATARMERQPHDHARSEKAPVEPGAPQAAGELVSEVPVSSVVAAGPDIAPQTPIVQPTRPSRLSNAARILRDGGLKALGARVAREFGAGGAQQKPAAEAPSSTQEDVTATRPDTDKIRLAVLVPSLDDAYIGLGAIGMLESLDRETFDIVLIRANAVVNDGGVPRDVGQYVLVPEPAVPCIGGAVTDELALRRAEELGWLSDSANGLSGMLSTLKVDAVLALGFYASLLATMAQRYAEAPTRTLAFMHSRAEDFADSAYGGDLYAALIRENFGHASRVLAPDARVRDDLVGKFGIDPQAVLVVPDPIDVASARRADAPVLSHPWLAPGSPVVVAVSGPRSAGGLPYLVEALALARRHEPVRCLVQGPETLRAQLEVLAEEAGVSGAIDVVSEDATPFPSDPRAMLYVSAVSDTNVPPSVVEAVDAGCPVIATRSSEALGVFLGQGERGVLVPMKDAESLADAMLQIVWDAEGRVEMAERAGEYLRR